MDSAPSKASIIHVLKGKSPSLRALFREGPFRDAIERERLPNPSDMRASSMFDPADHLQARLGHITVNPQDQFNTEMLRATYVHAGGSEYMPDAKIVANRDQTSSKAFVDQLIEKARESRRLSLDDELLDRSGKALDVSPEVHPAMDRVRASFEPWRLGGATTEILAYSEGGRLPSRLCGRTVL
jgi:hypothetical protein